MGTSQDVEAGTSLAPSNKKLPRETNKLWFVFHIFSSFASLVSSLVSLPTQTLPISGLVAIDVFTALRLSFNLTGNAPKALKIINTTFFSGNILIFSNLVVLLCSHTAILRKCQVYNLAPFLFRERVSDLVVVMVMMMMMTVLIIFIYRFFSNYAIQSFVLLCFTSGNVSFRN